MAKATAFANDILKLIFNATAIADLAENDTSSPATTLAVALHTADPGAGGTQATNEAAYTSYARVTVARTTGGWTASTAGSTSPVAAITFPASGASGTTITHFSVGTGVSNKMLYSGTVTPNIAIGAAGITPSLTTATTVTEV